MISRLRSVSDLFRGPTEESRPFARVAEEARSNSSRKVVGPSFSFTLICPSCFISETSHAVARGEKRSRLFDAICGMHIN